MTLSNLILPACSKPLMLDAHSLHLFSSATSLEQLTALSNQKEKDYHHAASIAVIPIHGILAKRNSWLGQLLGVSSYDDIEAQLHAALANDAIKGIILDIDSPGGEVSGLFDIADQLYSAREHKTLWAVANESAYSAAYAIASACHKIYLSRTAGVGSIGVVASHIDQSAMDAQCGIAVTTLFAGKHKNDLTPHQPLSEDASRLLQQEIDRLYGLFVHMVARNRNMSEQHVRDTEAKLFYGSDAIAYGLADQLAGLPQAIGDLTHFLQPSLGNITMTHEPTPAASAQEPIHALADSSTISDARIKEAQAEGRNAYKRHVLGIIDACRIAGMVELCSDFIEQDSSLDAVKDQLMQRLVTQQQSETVIESHVTPVPSSASNTNPLIENARMRMKTHYDEEGV